VRTLKRLGYTVAIVSGGFTHVTDRLADELGIDHAQGEHPRGGRRAPDRPAPRRGDRPGRQGPGAARDRRGEIAAPSTSPWSRRWRRRRRQRPRHAGGGGLGIAFNAKPVVREAADTAVTVPYLDAVLFLLGIRRDDIERADAEDPGMVDRGADPGPGHTTGLTTSAAGGPSP
jgi:phosphoserine phosphatase